jgi:ribonuclease P protein component
VAGLLSERVAPGDAPDLQFRNSFNFTVAHRLSRKLGFDHVIHAESILNKYFKVFFVRNCVNHARLGIIVGKKTLPRAIERNRVKRIIRETFRRHNIKIMRLDLVVMVRHGISNDGNAQIKILDVLFSRVEDRCAKL